MSLEFLKDAADAVRATTPLVHCITNYVTVNDCANALLAAGASPIMSDELEDVVDITSICGGLDLNIGTLNLSSIEGMRAAGHKAAELDHPIVLDPVGAGASKLRIEIACSLLDELPVRVVRGNMSEVKALAGASSRARGVDVNPADVVDDDNLAEAAAFARAFAAKTGAVAATTGPIDVVADARRAFAIRNGVALQGKITGAGCMLTALTVAYEVAHADALEAAVAAVASMGLAGQVAAARMDELDGNGSFRTYLLDALYNQTGDDLLEGALVEELG